MRSNPLPYLFAATALTACGGAPEPTAQPPAPASPAPTVETQPPEQPQASDSEMRQLNHHARKVPIMLKFAGRMEDARLAGQDASCMAIVTELKPDITNSYDMVAYMPGSEQQAALAEILGALDRCVPADCASPVVLEMCGIASGAFDILTEREPALLAE